MCSALVAVLVVLYSFQVCCSRIFWLPGITLGFMFHRHWIFIAKFLYFKIFFGFYLLLLLNFKYLSWCLDEPIVSLIPTLWSSAYSETAVCELRCSLSFRYSKNFQVNLSALLTSEFWLWIDLLMMLICIYRSLHKMCYSRILVLQVLKILTNNEL